MKTIIAVHSNTYHGFSAEDALEGIALSGFRHVELSAVRNWTEHVMPDMPAEDIHAIEERMKNLGLDCPVLSAHCNLNEANRVQDFRRSILLAKQLGCKYIVSSVDEVHGNWHGGQDDDVLTQSLRSVLPDLAAANMQMGIEVHGRYGTGKDLKRLCMAIGSSRIGITYDTANVVYFGRCKPEEDIQHCANMVKTVHLKDKQGPDYAGMYPAIGKGKLKLGLTLERLLASGFDGPISVEIELDSDFSRRRKTKDDLALVNRSLLDSRRYLEALGLM